MIDGNFRNLSLLVDIRSFDRLELQVSCHARMNEQLDEKSIGHQEFRNEVDIPVATAAVLLSWVLLLKLREKLLEWSD